jgi:hypothetical protein
MISEEIDNYEIWRDWSESDISNSMEDYANYEYIMIWMKWYAVDDDVDTVLSQNGGVNEDLFRWLDL